MPMNIEVFFNNGDIQHFEYKLLENDKAYVPSIKYEGAFVIIKTDTLGSTIVIPESRIREIKTIQLEKIN
jgi:hypothetical protein